MTQEIFFAGGLCNDTAKIRGHFCSVSHNKYKIWIKLNRDGTGSFKPVLSHRY
jgi:hypothetical protein